VADVDKSTRMVRVPEYGTSKEINQLYLDVISGASKGKRFTLNVGKHIIGRADDAAVQLTDSELSRWHAEIKVELSGIAYVRDIGSTNGTVLNNEDLGEEVRRIKEGDKIHLGGVTTLCLSSTSKSGGSGGWSDLI